MIRLSVERSPIRQFLRGFAGMLLIVAALDMVLWHVLASAPTVGDDGALTTRGIVERRQDILWASLFVVAGGALLVASVIGLFRRAPVVELTDEALYLRVAGPSRGIRIPWEEIHSVRSSSDGEDAHVPSRELVIEVADPHRYPTDLWGAEWIGARLVVDADSWDVPPEEVAVHCNVAMARPRVEVTQAPVPEGGGAG